MSENGAQTPPSPARIPGLLVGLLSILVPPTGTAQTAGPTVESPRRTPDEAGGRSAPGSRGAPEALRGGQQGGAPSDGRSFTDGDDSEETGSSADLDMPDLDVPTDRADPLRLSAGPFAASRHLSFEGDDRTIRHRPPPYVGGWIDASVPLKYFDDLEAELRLQVSFGYGFTRSGVEPGLSSRELATELMVGGSRLYLFRRLADRVRAAVGLGFQATSVVVDPNPIYTGHRYLAADTGIRIRWNILPGLLTGLVDLAAQPVFATANSDGAHGPGRAFGVRSGAELAWHVASAAEQPTLRRLRLVAAYRHQRYRSQFPRSPLGSVGGTGVDTQHIGAIRLEFAIPSRQLR